MAVSLWYNIANVPRSNRTSRRIKEETMEKVVLDQESEVKENVLAGIVGAFLFSLAGAAVYVLLNMIGYIASISGLVGAVCAVKGYSVFSKKESKKGIVIAKKVRQVQTVRGIAPCAIICSMA